MPAPLGVREDSQVRSVRTDGYVPVEHPLRRVRAAVDAPLAALHAWLRDAAAPAARCTIAPEQMVRALLLQYLFVIRSERQLIDQIWCSVLLRWFVGVRLDEPKWDRDGFSRYRLQMLGKDIVRQMLVRGLTQAHREGLLSARALATRQGEISQYTSDVTAGVGRPGVLPYRDDARPGGSDGAGDRGVGTRAGADPALLGEKLLGGSAP
jgi:hypothetical protein